MQEYLLVQIHYCPNKKSFKLTLDDENLKNLIPTGRKAVCNIIHEAEKKIKAIPPYKIKVPHVFEALAEKERCLDLAQELFRLKQISLKEYYRVKKAVAKAPCLRKD